MMSLTDLNAYRDGKDMPRPPVIQQLDAGLVDMYMQDAINAGWQVQRRTESYFSAQREVDGVVDHLTAHADNGCIKVSRTQVAATGDNSHLLAQWLGVQR